ncbi:MAG: ribulose-phosphate 3-epimerase [Clostridiales bacterium]|nr:ribulose-phosphate 3-epimerase [Clostridiales bacterium]
MLTQEEILLGNKVSVSILSADMTRLAEVIKELENAEADMLHFDVMDGVFVDNISFGVPLLDAANKCTEMFMDVHLMIINPYKYIEQFVNAGADMITFHIESESDVRKTIDKIHSMGKKAGLSIRPKTPVDVLIPYLNILDMVLIMSVEPGFGGQEFIVDSLQKVRELKKLIDDSGRKIDIQIDGGINDDTAKLAVEAGVNVLVSGSYLFKSDNMKEAIMVLKNIR